MSILKLTVSLLLAALFAVGPGLAAVGSWNGIGFTAWNGVAITSWNGTSISTGGADYDTTVLADGAVLFWPMNEPSGTTMADLAGSNDGTYVGTPTLGETGPAGGGGTAVLFNGSSQYAEVPSVAAMNITGDMTLEVWAKPATLPGATKVVAGKGFGSVSQRQYQIGTSSGDKWRLVFSDGTDYFVINGTTTISTSRWDYIVATKSGSTLTLYVNGTSEGTLTMSTNTTTTATDFTVAVDGTKSTELFNGTVAKVAIYNTALSGSTITNHYNIGN